MNTFVLSEKLRCEIFDPPNQVEVDLEDPQMTLSDMYKLWQEDLKEREVEIKETNFPHESGFFRLYIAFGMLLVYKRIIKTNNLCKEKPYCYVKNIVVFVVHCMYKGFCFDK